MVWVRRTFLVAILFPFALALCVSASNAQGDNPEQFGVTPTSTKTTTGEITAVSPNSVSGSRMVAASAECHRQQVTMQYSDAEGPFIKFTGIKEWCYDGYRVTYGNMDVETWIRPELRYGSDQTGYRYVPSALKETDEFLTYDGRQNGAHESIRVGRFEYINPRFDRPTSVLMPYVSRTGRYNGACDGPLPKDVSVRVASVNPTEGAKSVPATANVEATFSRKMDANTIDGVTFYLADSETGAEIPATYSYDVESKTATLDPKGRLTPGVTYTATVQAGFYGVLTTEGDPISLTGHKVWSFIVAR